MTRISANLRLTLLLWICFAAWLPARSQSTQSAPTASVPAMVKFSGTIQGAPARTISVTFSLYQDQQGGVALWFETQSVTLNAVGHYSVNLGSTLPNGLPTELFTSGEARWLGVQPEGQAEQPRVLLLSVPYALKAADAETIGGLPPSAFVLATPNVAPSQATAPVANAATQSAAPPPGTVSGSGTANFVPLWTDNADIGNSVIFQSGTGAAAKIGINTTTPAASLDVKGGSTLRGLVALPSVGVATAAKGSNSQALSMTASSFNSTSNTAVNQNFRWQAEPTGNDTATPNATLNLLFGSGNGAPAETGLKVSGQGLVTFATGQTFPGTGTIFGVTAGTGLTGGGSTGSVTLNVDTTKVPELNVANTFTGNQTVSGNLTSTGVVTGSSFQIGSNIFGFGSYANSNAYLGFGGSAVATGTSNTATGSLALSQATTGSQNTAVGASALLNNTTGSSNTAIGNGALSLNSTGTNNTASGTVALQANTTGSYNTADGIFSLFNNTTGLFNTAVGYLSGPDSAHTALTNSTAIGAMATVTQSNSLVLGSIAGINGAGSNTNVGIGTTAPLFSLDVHGTGNFTGPVTFASTQTFPNTISGVSAGTGLTGGGTTGNVTLNLDTTKIPQLNVSNTFVGDQTVSGNLSSTGLMTGSGFQIGSNLFAFGSYANSNAFLGFSGNTTTTGTNNTANGYLALSSITSGGANTATGWEALTANSSGVANTATGVSSLFSNTTGNFNVANGQLALFLNTTGGSNTASGSDALPHNTTGSNNTASGSTSLYSSTTGNGNTAVGEGALFNNNTGSNNTALGYLAGPADVFHANLSNATAIGANAEVDQSNTMVLGSINGLNGATADTLVGIGTTTPAAKLDVHGTANFTGLITFAAGQTFPGAGTITGVTPGTALLGGGSSGSVTLSVDTTKVVTGVTAGAGLTGGGTGGVQTLNIDTTRVPQLSTANTFTNSQTVSGNLTATGVVSGSSYQIGSTLFDFGSATNETAFLGFAGNTTSTGVANTGTGFGALKFNTIGTDNTASGYAALWSNTSGSNNTAVGFEALLENFTGSNNTAIGYLADVTSTALNNATAIGAYSWVGASNSLVLGSVNGIHGATSGVNVGIGTTAPVSTLDVESAGAGLVAPIILLKNNAAVQSGTLGNSVDFRFALDGGSSVSNANAYMRAAEDGNSQYGAFMSFATMADGGSGAGPLERMRITASGLVGIGTSSPDAALSVNGSADKVGGGSWGTYSDRRLKDLGESFTSGLSQVLRINPIRYRYKEQNGMNIHDSEEHVGVVAQEIQRVIPEAVSENQKGFLLVNNDPIIWAMLNAIKEQQREIQRLTGKVGVLETALRATNPVRSKSAVRLSGRSRPVKATEKTSSQAAN
jgi:trimeric autotransporter adhesin